MAGWCWFLEFGKDGLVTVDVNQIGEGTHTTVKEPAHISILKYVENLNWPLDVYLRSVFDPDLVRLHRSSRPLGLIACRQLGAGLSRGDALVMLDSHMEVRVGM